MTGSWKVAVVGCGTAGPAAAVFLRRQGHEVTVFERAPECRAVGAGFLLQPSGMAVLGELGILDSILPLAARVTRLHVVKPTGKTLFDLEYGEVDPDWFGAGLHRPVLLNAMIGLMAEEGVLVRWGWEIGRASRVDGRWRLESTEGKVEEGFDLLIVADGARSKLRSLTGSGGVDRGYPWGAHWFIGENHGVFSGHELFQVVNGTRQLCGFLATGRAERDGEDLVSLFWSIKVAEDAAWRARPLEEWKRQIRCLCPKSDGFLDQIECWDQVLVARYGDVRMRKWHGDGVVVLGDAGHAMSPQLGQGVNLALQDASCLAKCLESGDPVRGLREYDRRRSWNLRYYQVATRWLTPWFQSDHDWLSPLRDGFFGLSRRVVPARKLMTRTMAGMMFNRSSSY